MRGEESTEIWRSYDEALKNFNNLMDDCYSFSTKVRKRLNMIAKNWKELTAFYFVKEAPATNNMLEKLETTLLEAFLKFIPFLTPG